MPTYSGARAQRALMDRAAEIQKQRDEQLAGYQTEATRVGTQQQQQLMGAQAGYQAQATNQQAGIQQQRDQTQFGYQTAGTTQQAGIQQARDQLLIQNQQQRDQANRQHEAQMQEQHVQGQMQVYNNQLSQGEILRLQRLKQGLSATDEAVQNGTLAPEEGQQMRLQLQSGIDPLQRRLVQANIHNEQARTQAVQQNTVQGATEFNRRQSILNQSAQDRIHMFQDPVTGMQVAQQLMPDGSYAPFEMGQHAQDRLMHLHERGMHILQSRQALEQGERMNPLQFQAAQQHLNHIRQLNPLQIEGLRQDVTQGRASHELRTAMGQFDLEQRQQMAPGQLEHQGLQNRALEQNIGQSARLFDPHVRSAMAGATSAEQRAITDRAHAEIAPEAARLSLQHSRGQITLQELQARHSQLLNHAMETQLMGNLTPQEQRDAERNHRANVEREYINYTHAMDQWRQHGGIPEREPQMPRWFNVGESLGQPGEFGTPSHPAWAMNRETRARVTAAAESRRTETRGRPLPEPLPQFGQPQGPNNPPAGDHGPQQPNAPGPAQPPPQAGAMPPPEQRGVAELQQVLGLHPGRAIVPGAHALSELRGRLATRFNEGSAMDRAPAPFRVPGLSGDAVYQVGVMHDIASAAVAANRPLTADERRRYETHRARLPANERANFALPE